MKLEKTFMYFLLGHQKEHNRSLDFIILMDSILTAAKYIQYYYQTGALQRNLGEAGTINVQGESVMTMDLLANKIVMHYLSESRQVIEATSEELTDEVSLREEGRYFVYFDPLDGSSNVAHSLPVGFLFGIAKRRLDGGEDYHLRTGREFIAAGVFVIPSGIFTFALKDDGAWRFLHDEAGIFIRPERIYLPPATQTWELSYNSGNLSAFSKPIQEWINARSTDYAFRYSGSLAVDFHRLLRNGGMFMYPAIVDHPVSTKNYPEGKLRLMYECAVTAFIINEAGGRAIDQNGDEILDIAPTDRHERSTLFMGNRELIEDIRKVLRRKGSKKSSSCQVKKK